jgi:putative transposase
MKEYQSLAHTRWDCKYHIVFIPKRRKRKLFGALRRHLGEVFWELAQHKEGAVVEGHLMPDHTHICLSILPKYAVSNMVGLSRAKVQSTSPAGSVVGHGISPVKCFGRAAILFQR